MADTPAVKAITELPLVVENIPDQPCSQLYERNPVLLGYDVVQYHFIPSYRDGGVAVRGIPEHAYNVNGYQFWFSTKENRNLFINDPWKYAPAWGGFCSFGVALERPPRWPWETNFLGPPASPWEGWFIVDGVLMFNIWSSYTDTFLSNRDENIESAKQIWKQWFQNNLQSGPFNTHCIGHGPLKNWCLSQQPYPWLQPLPQCNVAFKDTAMTMTMMTNTTTATIGDDNKVEQAAVGSNNNNNNSGNSIDNISDTVVGSSINNENAPIDDDIAISFKACQEEVLAGSVVSKECLDIVTVTGGTSGITEQSFSDFSNQSISPYSINLIRILSSVGAVIIVLLLLFVCRRRIRRRCCLGNNNNGDNNNQDEFGQHKNNKKTKVDKSDTDDSV